MTDPISIAVPSLPRPSIHSMTRRLMASPVGSLDLFTTDSLPLDKSLEIPIPERTATRGIYGESTQQHFDRGAATVSVGAGSFPLAWNEKIDPQIEAALAGLPCDVVHISVKPPTIHSMNLLLEVVQNFLTKHPAVAVIGHDVFPLPNPFLTPPHSPVLTGPMSPVQGREKRLRFTNE